MQKLTFDFFAVGNCMNTWMFAGKIGCLQNCGSVTSGKSDPCIFPWRFCIGTVDDLRIRIHKKGIFGRKKMGFVVDFVCAFSRDHIVNQVVVADSGSPLIAGIA